jgi:hypothetical protein
MNFQLVIQLFRPNTWVVVKLLPLSQKILLQSCWWCGWLTQVKDFMLWVPISKGKKHFRKFILWKNVWKTVKNKLKIQIKLLRVQKAHYFDTDCTELTLSTILKAQTSHRSKRLEPYTSLLLYFAQNLFLFSQKRTINCRGVRVITFQIEKTTFRVKRLQSFTFYGMFHYVLIFEIELWANKNRFWDNNYMKM